MSNQQLIEQIASQHLGKAGDGTTVKPYETPETVDPSLLVAVPRYLNREMYNINEATLPFVGVDVWNCYEFSTLMDNGYPLTGVLKLSYPANNPSIVESKSLKLYLNSYNMARVVGDDQWAAETAVVASVERDLSALLETRVAVSFKSFNRAAKDPLPLAEYEVIENKIYNLGGVAFDAYTETPSLLKIKQAYTDKPQRITTNALRSNCQITHQPDWGDVFIYVAGPKHLDEKSVLQYIVSMRKENHFHEEIVECIFKRLCDLLPFGTDIGVAALYTRRGGIDINPIRATSFGVLKEFETITNTEKVSPKTSRQ